MATLTKAQENAIEALKVKFLGFYGGAENKEFKTATVKVYDNGVAYVMLEVGYIGDEGTAKELFARDTMSVMVGKQGGYFKYSDSASHYKKSFRNATMACIGGHWK